MAAAKKSKKAKSTHEKQPYVKCRAFRQHNLDGPTFQEETPRLGLVWVAYLECSECGVKRYDVMEPETCVLIHRSYDHPPDYDTSLTSVDAKRILFKSKLVKR